MDFSVGEAVDYVNAAKPRRKNGDSRRGPPFNLV